MLLKAIPPQIKLIAGLAVVAGLFFAGWQVRGWHEDSRQLAATEAVQKAIDAAMGRESKIAAAVESKLSELKANQTVIDRGVIREVVKPEYRNVCLPDAALRLLADAARGEAKGDTAKPADKVPGPAADAP